MDNSKVLSLTSGPSFFSSSREETRVFRVTDSENEIYIDVSCPRQRDAAIYAIANGRHYRLSLADHHSNEEVDLYLERYGNSANILPSLFLHNKDQERRSVEENARNHTFLQNSFTEDALALLNAGQPLVIPVRSSDNYSERAGHWQMLRLTYNPETQKITPVIVNSSKAIANKVLSEIINDYSFMINSISDHLTTIGVEHEMDDMRYCETRQHGVHGCGITTIYNILNNESADLSRCFTEEDQEDTVETGSYFNEDTQKQVSYHFPTKALKEKAKDKIHRIGLGNEALIRVRMAELIQEQQQEVAYEATQSPALAA